MLIWTNFLSTSTDTLSYEQKTGIRFVLVIIGKFYVDIHETFVEINENPVLHYELKKKDDNMKMKV